MQLQEIIDAKVRILDSDEVSVKTCCAKGLDATVEDALKPNKRGDEDVVCFNLILHHLVGVNEFTTLNLQRQALDVWGNQAKMIFVNELSYDSFIGNVSGRLIYFITSNKILSSLAQTISRFVPSLHANTFGVGVRFRSHVEWIKLFEQWGFRVVSSVRGPATSISLARRLLLIRSIRKDSYILMSRMQTIQ